MISEAVATPHAGLSSAPRAAALAAVPTVSFSTLARVMGPSSPSELKAMLRGHKTQAAGPRRSYQLAVKQAIDLVVDRIPLDASAPLRKHEREAVEALIRNKPHVPLWVDAIRHSDRNVWDIEGIRVTVNPDVVFEGRLDRGAAKFVFTKTPLATGVGNTMAALLWYYLERVARRDHVVPRCCIVYEPRFARTYIPREKLDTFAKQLPAATAIIRALWPLL